MFKQITKDTTALTKYQIVPKHQNVPLLGRTRLFWLARCSVSLNTINYMWAYVVGFRSKTLINRVFKSYHSLINHKIHNYIVGKFLNIDLIFLLWPMPHLDFSNDSTRERPGSITGGLSWLPLEPLRTVYSRSGKYVSRTHLKVKMICIVTNVKFGKF